MPSPVTLKSCIDFKSVEFSKYLFKSEKPILKSFLEIDKQLNTCEVPDTITGYVKNCQNAKFPF